MTSIFGLLILIADIYGIIQIVQSKAADMKKAFGSCSSSCSPSSGSSFGISWALRSKGP